MSFTQILRPTFSGTLVTGLKMAAGLSTLKLSRQPEQTCKWQGSR